VRKTRADIPLATEQVRDCTFRGRVVLGVFSPAARHQVDGVPFASGLYRSTLYDVVALDDALVLNSLALRGVLLEPRASVVQCGSVLGATVTADVSAAATPFGNGQMLHVGVESGGRDLRVVADLPFERKHSLLSLLVAFSVSGFIVLSPWTISGGTDRNRAQQHNAAERL
jgi:hypothetical protein